MVAMRSATDSKKIIEKEMVMSSSAFVYYSVLIQHHLQRYNARTRDLIVSYRKDAIAVSRP
jgi:hypothetical protein